MDNNNQQQQQQQAPPAGNNNNNDDIMLPGNISTRKLVAVAILAALALLLGTTVATLQLMVLHRKHQIVKKRRSSVKPAVTDSHPASKQTTNTASAAPTQSTLPSSTTTRPMRETRRQDLHLWKRKSAPYSNNDNNARTSADHYWNQVKPVFAQWDAMLMPDPHLHENTNIAEEEESLLLSTSANLNDKELVDHLWDAFYQAVQLGHADAQFAYAQYLASGIPPFAAGHEHASDLLVNGKMVDTTDMDQTTQSLLNYHFAAMDGHVEAQLSMGYRQWVDTKFSWHSLPNQECERALPYYQAAANGIMDILESSRHSRAKYPPPLDGHVLSELHAQGNHAKTGQSYYNAPDEPAEALQFYHMRATQQDDIGAAFTLGQYYHVGIRGVQQNLTKAIYYYDLAANLNHWESAGHCGMFHLWGLGMDWHERNLYKAHRYFTKGAPVSVEECRKRFWRRKQNDKSQCDVRSLNGLGLLHLLGVPMVVSVDLEKAKEYFQLAQEMGSSEARYHMAMMRLGWKTYWVELHQLTDDPVPEELPSFMSDRATVTQAPGPTKTDYIMAIQELVAAANKGHIQSKHRLGMMYADGVNVTLTDGRSLVAVARDCSKALKHFDWIAENANPFLTNRLRRAYEQYKAGDYEASLRNYLVASEYGNEVAQTNAAFLLEQGVCLGLSRTDCATASGRLWAGACNSVVELNPDACLHVGDLFYYGRLREWGGDFSWAPGPFGWLPLVLYPEKSLWPYVETWYRRLFEWFRGHEQDTGASSEKSDSCPVDQVGEDGTCLVATTDFVDPAVEEEASRRENDLAVAASYYARAARGHKSARGNFNLGFMHEWGLGVKQDFPLAKRHYDLAASVKPGEADLVVKIALMAMNLHQRFVKFTIGWSDQDPAVEREAKPQRVPQIGSPEVGHPLPGPKGAKRPRTEIDVILSHLFSWETGLILVLTWILLKMLMYRRTGR